MNRTPVTANKEQFIGIIRATVRPVDKPRKTAPVETGFGYANVMTSGIEKIARFGMCSYN